MPCLDTKCTPRYVAGVLEGHDRAITAMINWCWPSLVTVLVTGWCRRESGAAVSCPPYLSVVPRWAWAGGWGDVFIRLLLAAVWRENAAGTVRLDCMLLFGLCVGRKRTETWRLSFANLCTNTCMYVSLMVLTCKWFDDGMISLCHTM